MRLAVGILVTTLISNAVALDVRDSATAYPVQAKTGDFKAGVEYLVRSFPVSPTFLIDDYLVLEVGIFPQNEANVDLRRFTLRINGKTLSMTQTPGMVAASVKYPDWSMKPSVQVGIGPIILGRDPQVQRFPGDNRAGNPLPRNSEAITPEAPPIDYGELITLHALPEGKFNKPVAGLIFFPYKGKLKSLKSVELLIDDVALKLR